MFICCTNGGKSEFKSSSPSLNFMLATDSVSKNTKYSTFSNSAGLSSLRTPKSNSSLSPALFRKLLILFSLHLLHSAQLQGLHISFSSLWHGMRSSNSSKLHHADHPAKLASNIRQMFFNPIQGNSHLLTSLNISVTSMNTLMLSVCPLELCGRYIYTTLALIFINSVCFWGIQFCINVTHI